MGMMGKFHFVGGVRAIDSFRLTDFGFWGWTGSYGYVDEGSIANVCGIMGDRSGKASRMKERSHW